MAANNILDTICQAKRQHVLKQKEIYSPDMLRKRITTLPKPRSFTKSITTKVSQQQVALIAEVKKASPSKGVIRSDFDPVSIAMAYEKAGATCISVLTDIDYFQGQDAYLTQIKSVTTIPVLRKDFMIDPYQILESRALGADCILLIMAALSLEEALMLEELALSLDLSVLVEVHNQKELESALQLKTPLLGINNRNLKDLTVDLNTTHQLLASIPKHKTLICESGIHNRDDILQMTQVGVYGFLIGEMLMRQKDIEQATRDLLK